MKNIFEALSRGMLLIVLGVIFLLINFNYLSWGFWWNVIYLWPLLLIMAGIGLFFSKRVPFSAVVSVFLIFLLGYSLVYGERNFANNYEWHWNIDSGSERGSSDNASDLYVPLDSEVEKVNFVIDVGGGTLDISSHNERDNQTSLIKGNYEWRGAKGEPSLKHTLSGKTMDLKFSPSSSLLKWGTWGQSKLTMTLSQKPVYHLSIDAGAVNGVIDLSALKVEELEMDTGASDFELRLGDTGTKTKVKLDSAASKIRLVVPETVGLKVSLSGVASNTNFMGSGLLHDDKTWVSENYNQADTQVEMSISLAAGEIELVQ